MTRTLQGVVHGKTIELADDPGLPEGERVEVTVRPARQEPPRAWGEGIRRSAGGWADYPEMDEIMERIYQERKRERRPQFES